MLCPSPSTWKSPAQQSSESKKELPLASWTRRFYCEGWEKLETCGHPIPSHPIPSHPTIRSLWSKTLDSCCIRSSSKKSAGFGEPGAVFKLAFSRVKWLSTGWNPEMMLVDVGWCFFSNIFTIHYHPGHRGHHNHHLSLVLWPCSHSLRTLTTALVCSSSCLACHRKVPTVFCSYGSKDSKETICGKIQIIPDPFWKRNMVFQRITANPHLVKRLHWRRLSWHPWELGCRFLTSLSSSSSSSSVTTGFGVIPNRSHARWKLVKTTCENSDENLWKPHVKIQMKTCESLIVSTCDMSILCQLCLTMRKFSFTLQLQGAASHPSSDFKVAASGLMGNWEIPVPSCWILRLLLLALIGGKNSWLILFD